MKDKMFDWTTPEGKIFVGCMFIGIGIGMLLGEKGRGTMLGISVGIIAEGIYSKMKKITK
tara:strand:- start:1912 stop:2091 length:180 start_codon:yes stop_codon:yes gene_type:complete